MISGRKIIIDSRCVTIPGEALATARTARASRHFNTLFGSVPPIPEAELECEGLPQVPRSSGRTGRVIRAAIAKYEGFAITIDARCDWGNRGGIDLERGAPVWTGREVALSSADHRNRSRET